MQGAPLIRGKTAEDAVPVTTVERLGETLGPHWTARTNSLSCEHTIRPRTLVGGEKQLRIGVAARGTGAVSGHYPPP